MLVKVKVNSPENQHLDDKWKKKIIIKKKITSFVHFILLNLHYSILFRRSLWIEWPSSSALQECKKPFKFTQRVQRSQQILVKLVHSPLWSGVQSVEELLCSAPEAKHWDNTLPHCLLFMANSFWQSPSLKCKQKETEHVPWLDKRL